MARPARSLRPLRRTLGVGDQSELVRLYEDDVSLVWLKRDQVPEAQDLLERESFSWANEVSGSGAGLATLEPLVGSSAVLREVKELVELHAALFETTSVGLRVALTQAPMCPAFHVDRVLCRAIVTLAGAGTQWVKGSLASAAEGAEHHQLGAGEVGWFKGTEWPGAAAVVHRSPPGLARRLVLTLDLL
jgi:Protein of unknown function (DUF1826)